MWNCIYLNIHMFSYVILYFLKPLSYRETPFYCLNPQRKYKWRSFYGTVIGSIRKHHYEEQAGTVIDFSNSGAISASLSGHGDCEV